MNWEYRLLPVGLDRADQITEDALNKHGRGGWELVSVYESGFRVFVLKRPVLTIGKNSGAAEEPTASYAPTACS